MICKEDNKENISREWDRLHVTKYHIEIEELILEGFNRAIDEKQIDNAIKQELIMLISKNRIIQTSVFTNNTNVHKLKVSNIDAGSINIASDPINPNAIGNDVANSIYRGLISRLES